MFDILIATLALEHDCSLINDDRHFALIPGNTILSWARDLTTPPTHTLFFTSKVTFALFPCAAYSYHSVHNG